jgi:hypothetical protein
MTLALAILLGGQDPLPSDVKQALQVLVATPDDQKAATTAGRWYAQAGDFEKAMPLLAKGSDEVLRKMAEREAAAGDNAYELVEIGDEWLKLSSKTPKAKASYRGRAIHWYGRGWEKLNDPVWRMKLREKLLQMAGITDALRGPGAAKGWDMFEAGKTCATDQVGHSGARSLRMWNAPDDLTKKPGASTAPMITKAGNVYKISAWVLVDGGDAPGDVRLRFWDASGKFMGQQGAVIPGDAPYWQEIKAEVTAPAGAAKMDCQVIVISKAGRTWVDDVSVKLDGQELVQNGSFEK